MKVMFGLDFLWTCQRVVVSILKCLQPPFDVNRGWGEAHQARPNGELELLYSYVIDPTFDMGCDEGMVVDGTGISTVNKVEPVLFETADVDSSELGPTGPVTDVEEVMPAGVEHARRRSKRAKKVTVHSSHSSECTSPPTRNCRKSASPRLTRKVTDVASDGDDEEPAIDERRKRR